MLADKQYADAVRISNFDSKVGLNYVNFLLRRGNVDRAEQFLTELSKRSPKNLDILLALARVELGRGDWAGAQAVAHQSVIPIRVAISLTKSWGRPCLGNVNMRRASRFFRVPLMRPLQLYNR